MAADQTLHRGVCFDRPENRDYLEWSGICKDLLTVQILCDRALAIGVENPNDILFEAVWQAAVIRYGRVFGSAPSAYPQYLLRILLENLSTQDAWKERHKEVMDLRHWHVAHPQGSLEDYCVWLTVSDEPSGARTISVGSAGRKVSLTPISIHQLKELARISTVCALEMRGKEEQKVLEAARVWLASQPPEVAPPFPFDSPAVNRKGRRYRQKGMASSKTDPLQ